MTSMQLQSAGELRRPDQHGQLPHIISTTYPDRPLSELQIDDILDINWTAVKTAARDAIIRVKHEGDLSPSTVRDTVRLIALALRKLEMEDAELQRVIANWHWVGIVGWILACTPTKVGKTMRDYIGARQNARRKQRMLTQTREDLFGLRIELAAEVDEKIDASLAKNEAYRELQVQPASYRAVRSMAKGILSELKELDELEQSLARNNDGEYTSVRQNRARKKQIEAKIPACIDFCISQRQSSVIVRRVDDRAQLEMCLKQIAAELDAKAEPIERQLAAMRDEIKQELYGDANDVP